MSGRTRGRRTRDRGSRAGMPACPLRSCVSELRIVRGCEASCGAPLGTSGHRKSMNRLSAASRIGSVSLFTGPTGWISTVPAYWERPDSDRDGSSGPVPAFWERLLHLQGQTLTLKPSPKLNGLTLSAETMPCRERTLLLIDTLRCQIRQQFTTLLHQDA